MNQRPKQFFSQALVLSILLVVTLVLFHFSREKKTAPEILTNQKWAEAAPISSRPPSTRPKKSKDGLNTEGHPDDSPQDDRRTNESPQDVNEPDQVRTEDNGVEYKVVPRKKKIIQDMLTLKDKENPADEFNKLMPIDFNKAESGMFSGVFADQQASIKLALYFDGSTYQLTEDSCFLPPDGRPIPNLKGRIQMRDDQNGYAVIYADGLWYLRMGYAFSPKRNLVGKLYKKIADHWTFVSDFSAFEVPHAEKPLKTCQFP